MEYVLGAAAGFGAGALIGVIKNLIIWKSVLNGRRTINVKQYNRRSLVSTLIDICVLVAIILTKDMFPIYFPATLACALIGIAVARKISPATQILKHVK